MPITQFVDWILTSHIHFIIGHPHQSTQSLAWPVSDLYQALQSRLCFHPGFPRLKQLHCPIFTQNKFDYYVDLPNGIMMPTFKIPLQRHQDDDAMRTFLVG